jgi:hypothetical protein
MRKSSRSKLVSFTLVKGLIQSIRCASPRQHLTGSPLEARYVTSEASASMTAFSAHTTGTGWTTCSLIPASLRQTSSSLRA